MATRTKILREAVTLYLKEGYAGFSMRKLADRVGFGASALYKHYENKDRILIEMMRWGFLKLEKRLVPDSFPQDSLAALRQASLDYVSFGLEEPELYRLLFMGPERIFEHVRTDEAFRDISMRTYEYSRRLIEQGVKQRVIRPVEPFRAAYFLWTTNHGCLSLYLSGMTAIPVALFREFHNAALENVLSGLAK